MADIISFDYVNHDRVINADGSIDIIPRIYPLPLASPDQVLAGVEYLDTQGSVTLPPVNKVQEGYLYGPNQTYTGTLPAQEDDAPDLQHLYRVTHVQYVANANYKLVTLEKYNTPTGS